MARRGHRVIRECSPSPRPSDTGQVRAVRFATQVANGECASAPRCTGRSSRRGPRCCAGCGSSASCCSQSGSARRSLLVGWIVVRRDDLVDLALEDRFLRSITLTLAVALFARARRRDRADHRPLARPQRRAGGDHGLRDGGVARGPRRVERGACRAGSRGRRRRLRRFRRHATVVRTWRQHRRGGDRRHGRRRRDTAGDDEHPPARRRFRTRSMGPSHRHDDPRLGRPRRRDGRRWCRSRATCGACSSRPARHCSSVSPTASSTSPTRSIRTCSPSPICRSSTRRRACSPKRSPCPSAIGYSLGVRIDDYVLINMQGFLELIDAVGGVTLDLERSVPLPPALPGAKHDIPSSVGPGTVEMDGTLALAFVRSRYADSDYGRTGRQRQLLAALGEQISFADAIGGFSSVASALSDAVRTSLSPNEFTDLLDTLGDTAVDHRVGRPRAPADRAQPPRLRPDPPDRPEVHDAITTGVPSQYA